MNINKWNNVFDEYVKQYDMTDSDILYKYNHTYRVCNHIKNICDSINSNEERKNLSYLIALLHDIGRFYQDKIFNTYIENGKFDHGDYGVKLLFEDGLIRKFIETNKYDKLIRLAVKNHNKYAIEDGLSEEELIYCKLVRDADKLDIFNNAINIGKINHRENDYSNISEKVNEDFYAHKMINLKYRETNNDSMIVLMSQIYDLNFIYSYKYLRNNKVTDKIYIDIKDKEKFKPYFDEINKYIEKRCEDVR